jgi:hypothetical protein
MRSSDRPRRRLRRVLFIVPFLAAVTAATTLGTSTSASAEPSSYCDYLAEQGIIGADSMVRYRWAHGCW